MQKYVCFQKINAAQPDLLIGPLCWVSLIDWTNMLELISTYNCALLQDGQSGDIVDDPNEAATGDDEAQQFKRKAYEMMGKLGAFNQLEGKLCMRIFCEHEEVRCPSAPYDKIQWSAIITQPNLSRYYVALWQ